MSHSALGPASKGWWRWRAAGDTALKYPVLSSYCAGSSCPRLGRQAGRHRQIDKERGESFVKGEGEKRKGGIVREKKILSTSISNDPPQPPAPHQLPPPVAKFPHQHPSPRCKEPPHTPPTSSPPLPPPSYPFPGPWLALGPRAERPRSPWRSGRGHPLIGFSENVRIYLFFRVGCECGRERCRFPFFFMGVLSL